LKNRPEHQNRQARQRQAEHHQPAQEAKSPSPLPPRLPSRQPLFQDHRLGRPAEE
jgi:hypothetical protein